MSCLRCDLGFECQCLVQGANLVTVTGLGEEETPYEVSLLCAVAQACACELTVDLGLACGEVAAGCIPDVMGSPDWTATTGADLRHSYDVAGEFYYPSPPTGQQCTSIWPDTFTEFQSIAATISNFGTNNANGLDGGGNPNICNDYIGLECRRGGGLFLGDGLGIYFHRYTDSPTGGFDPDTWEWWVDCEVGGSSIYIDASSPQWAAWPYGETFRLLLESEPNGDYRVYVDGVLLTSGTVPALPTGPSKFSFYSDSDNGDLGDKDRVPHFADICMLGSNVPDEVPGGGGTGTVWTATGDGGAEWGGAPPPAHPPHDALTWLSSRAQNDGSGFSSGTVNCIFDAGSDGDLRIALLTNESTVHNVTASAPAGWTALATAFSGDHSIHAWYRIKQSGDPNTIALTVGSGNNNVPAASGHRFSGHDPTTPIAASSAIMQVSASGVQPPDIVLSEDAALICLFGDSGSFGAWATATGGWTERFDASCGTSVLIEHALYTKDSNPGGPATVSPCAATCTGGNGRYGGIFIAVNTPVL